MTEPIQKNDLILLMEAYENSVKLNTIVTEQQRHLLEKQNTTINNIDKILDKFGKCTESVGITRQSLEKGNLKIRFRLVLLGSGLGVIVLALIGLCAKLFSKFDEIDLLSTIHNNIISLLEKV